MPLIPVALLSSPTAPTASVLPSPLSETREAELVALDVVAHTLAAGVRRLDVGVLRPGVSGAREDVGGARLRNRVVVLITVHAGRGARFPRRGHRQRISVAAEREAEAELIALTRVRGLDVRLLRPGVAAPHVDIDGAGVVERVVVLVAVDAARRAALVRGADRDRVAVAAHGQRVADVARQRAAAREMVEGVAVRRLEIRELSDRRARAFLAAGRFERGGDSRRACEEHCQPGP